MVIYRTNVNDIFKKEIIMKFKLATIVILLSISPYQVMAGSDKTVTFVNNVKFSGQVDAVVKRAKKGDLIGINPNIVDDVCDFNKQIFVNNYIKGAQVTAYCSYIGHARKLINK